jgi:hypothetical protein
MGNACASVCASAQDVAADAKAEAAKLAVERESAKAEVLDKRIENSDAKLDKDIMKERGLLNEVMKHLSTVIIEYQRVLDGDPTQSVLSMPQLAVWAMKEDESFCGNKAASEGIHMAAARIAMIAEARSEFLGDPAKDNVEGFKEAKAEIKGALTVCRFAWNRRRLGSARLGVPWFSEGEGNGRDLGVLTVSLTRHPHPPRTGDRGVH